MSRAPKAAAADGLSKLTGPVERLRFPAAGDFLNCWGDERAPCGEKAAEAEKGVETEGVAAAPW